MHYKSIMATITLKEVPEELRDLLKKRAEGNRRSLNQELLYCLERVVGFSPKVDQEWRDASRDGLLRVWDNAEDDIYNELLQK